MATIGTFTSGSVLTASELNNAIPLCILENTSQNVPSGVNTAVTFATEVLDPLNWHSTVTNNTRITPNIAGFYLVTMQMNDVNGAGQTRAALSLTKNGAEITGVRIRMDTTGEDDDFALAGYVQCNGTTDYLEMNVLQNNSGGVSRTITARFTVQFVHP
jgi:hypothetical protein